MTASCLMHSLASLTLPEQRLDGEKVAAECCKTNTDYRFNPNPNLLTMGFKFSRKIPSAEDLA